LHFVVRAAAGALFVLTPNALLAAQESGQSPLGTQASDEPADPEAIVVTGTRTRLPVTALPLTVDVVGGKELTDQVAVSGSVIDAVSAKLPAFSPTREKLSGAGESLRGRSPLFAINGVPQSTPIRDGSRDGYTIDPFFIDRVEVIYGSNALQGIGATGGVVNQVTVGAPLTDGVRIKTLVQGTAQDGFDGEAMGGKAAGLVGYRAGAFDLTAGATFERRGAFLDGHGDRIGVDGTQGDIQDSDSWSVFGRLGYDMGPDTRVELIANRFNLEGRGHYVQVPGFPATSEKGDPEGVPPANRAELLSASFTQGNLAGGDFTAQAFFSRTRDIFGGSITGTFQDSSIAPIGTLFDQSVNKSRKLGAKFGYERTAPGLEALTLTAGLDLLHDRTAQTLLATGRTWVPESSFSSIAPFLQGNLKLLEGTLRLAGGVRYEKVALDVPDFTTLAFYGAREVGGGKPSFHKALLNGGVIVEPMKGLRAYASYAEGYTIADVGRILRAINTDGVDVDNFLSLEPVVSNNREIGVEWKRGWLQASAAYWWSSSELGSLLVRNPDGIFDVARQPIELEGLDLSLDARLPIDGLSIGGAYARVRGQTDNNDADDKVNNDLDGANIAPDRLNLYAAYENGPFDARLATRFYFERKFDDPGSDSDFEGYTLVDASAGYRFGKHRVSLSAMNLFDKYYVSYNSDTVAATDPTRFFAGRGRTITLGLTSRF
jgi:iron complex outermembrane receptor protein